MKHALYLAFAFGAGCLPSVSGSSAPPECHVDTDCPVAGQVCDEELCWGDPPPGTYAAQLGPPASNRPDLVVTEVPDLAIPFDGGFGDLIIQAPVHIGGRVHLGCQAATVARFAGCDASAAVAATVSVSRPSRIPGGQPYTDLSSSDPTAAVGDSFSLGVPRLALDDTPYTVTITPSDTMPLATDGPTPAELAPPLTIEIDATDDKVGLDVVLGQGSLRTVTGRIVDATGYGVAQVRVSALGRFDAARPLERVSTVGVTDAGGYYTIYIAEAALSIVDIVGHPADQPGLTLRLRDVEAQSATQAIADMHLPAAGKAISVTLPVVGHNGAGQSTPVAAAAIDVVTELDDPNHPAQLTTFEVGGSTDDKGNAALALIPASGTTLREYHVRINPPPMSEFASVYDQRVEVGTGGGVVGAIDLPHRVAVTGSLVDADGNSAGGVTVTAQPALRLALTLDPATQSILSELQPPSATTADDGSYFVWVDPDLAGTAASYDLDCVPAAGARTPRWTFHDILLQGPSVNIEMGAIQLPRGRHVRGRVVDESGKAVTGSEVRLFQVVSDAGLCMVASLPADCVLPAALRALDRSDQDGQVRLVVPDPR